MLLLQEIDTGRYILGEEAAAAVATARPGVEVKWEKMSKSKGNGVDPTSIIREVGVDATRLNVLFKVACLALSHL